MFSISPIHSNGENIYVDVENLQAGTHITQSRQWNGPVAKNLTQKHASYKYNNLSITTLCSYIYFQCFILKVNDENGK